MKMTTLKSVAIAVGLASSAFGQATSPVVGYETISLNQSFNFIGLRLHEKPVSAGTLEVVGSTSVEDTGVDFAALLDGTTTYILEIEDEQGSIVELLGTAGSAAGVLSTNVDLQAAGVVADVSYTLRPASTLLSALGAADSGNLASGTSAIASDQVLVPDGSGGFDTYFVLTSGGFGGTTQDWVQLDPNGTTAVVDPATIPLVYADGIIINAFGARDIVISGDLKTSNTSQGLSGSFNFLSSVYPVGATLASTFGSLAEGPSVNDTGLASGTSAIASDQILIPSASGFDVYFVLTGGGFGGTTFDWVQLAADGVTTTSVDPSSIAIPSGYLINAFGPNNATTSAPTFFDGL